jgi:branched-chain amino acid aminotransferase
MKVWIDGQLLDSDEAKVSVFDHGLLYGDGVFEGIRIYSGRIFECQAHVDRLYESARRIRLQIPYTKDEIVEAMEATLAAADRQDGYIRLVVTRGAGTLGLNPFLCPKPTVIVIVDGIRLYPEQMYREGMSVIISKVRRCGANMLDPQVKSLNYLNNIRAKIECIDAGVSEAIMLNADGHVAECTGDNIFIVSDGVVITPPLEAGILEGVTRGLVLNLAEQMGIEIRETCVSVPALLAADECFLTGTAAEVIAVTRVDETPIGDGKPGPITSQLREAFFKYARGGA